MTYVDGFLIPVPKKRLAAYRRMASLGAKVWMEHGALDYKECVAEDLAVDNGQGKKVTPFADLTKLKRDETLVFAWITYRSKAHRAAVNKKVATDPRILASMAKPMPFDMARMCYGGFEAMVEATPLRKAARAPRKRAAPRAA